MPAEWMKEVNEILRAHRFRQGDYFLRFQATMYPRPTIAIAVYYDGHKVFEKPIRRLSEFIEDLQDIRDILREVKVQPKRKQDTKRNRNYRRQQRNRNDNKIENEVEDNEKEDEEENYEENDDSDLKRS